jgi:hypothetical protein
MYVFPSFDIVLNVYNMSFVSYIDIYHDKT